MLYIVNTKVLTMLYTTEIDTGLNPRCQSYLTLKVAIEVLDSCRLRRGRSELGITCPPDRVPQTPAEGWPPSALPLILILE